MSLFPVPLSSFRDILNSKRIKEKQMGRACPEGMVYTHILQSTMTTTTVMEFQDFSPLETTEAVLSEGAEV